MEIPTIDLNNIESIKTSLQHGFFYLDINKEHLNLINTMMNKIKLYFNQDEKIKMQDIKIKNGLGYSQSAKERKNKIIEIKESYTYRSDYIKNDPIYDEYIKNMNIYAKTVFEKIMETFDIHYDKEIINPSFNTLNLLKYPKKCSNENIIGINEHTDWGFLTLIITDREGL
jgi:isopenicillin N synthase-like dioxygenase